MILTPVFYLEKVVYAEWELFRAFSLPEKVSLERERERDKWEG